MFYKLKLMDYIRVHPNNFADELKTAVIKEIKKKYEGYISKDVGFVVDVLSVEDIGEGIIIHGDGASYFPTKFSLIIFKPEVHEVVYGEIRDIADFGAFITIGPVDGMIHVSQTMNDFVSFSKEKTLAGKESNRTLRVGDKCKAKIIAVSFKDLSNPKLGLTMRQQGLGKLEWITDDLKDKTGNKKE